MSGGAITPEGGQLKPNSGGQADESPVLAAMDDLSREFRCSIWYVE